MAFDGEVSRVWINTFKALEKKRESVTYIYHIISTTLIEHPFSVPSAVYHRVLAVFDRQDCHVRIECKKNENL